MWSCPTQSGQKQPWKTTEPEAISDNSTEQPHNPHLFINIWCGFALELFWQPKIINNITFPLICGPHSHWCMEAKHDVAEIHFFPLFLHPLSFAKNTQSHQ